MIIFHIALSSPWSTYREPLSEVLPYLTVSKKTSAMSIRRRERTGPIGPRFFPGCTRLFPRPSSAGEGRDGGKRDLDHALGRNMQQLARIIAQDHRPLGIAQARGLENVLHRRARPRIGIGGAHDDLASIAFRRQLSAHRLLSA